VSHAQAEAELSQGAMTRSERCHLNLKGQEVCSIQQPKGAPSCGVRFTVPRDPARPSRPYESQRGSEVASPDRHGARQRLEVRRSVSIRRRGARQPIGRFLCKAITSAFPAYSVLIIDSLSHAWRELLEEVDRVSARKGNRWRGGPPELQTEALHRCPVGRTTPRHRDDAQRYRVADHSRRRKDQARPCRPEAGARKGHRIRVRPAARDRRRSLRSGREGPHGAVPGHEH